MRDMAYVRSLCLVRLLRRRVRLLPELAALVAAYERQADEGDERGPADDDHTSLAFLL
jgi:hypothetical protein